MDNFMEKQEEKKSVNKLFLIALLIGAVAIAVFLLAVSLKKSPQQVQTDALTEAFREGTPQFDKYTKKIVCETDQDLTQFSPNGLGVITMFIHGKVINITGKTLTGLELQVGVVDSFGKVIREKTAIVIPKEAEQLATGQTLPVQINIEGFNKDDDMANIRWKVTAIKVQE